ncbi:MAG: YdcF family protein [Acetobacteraceae bacterium]|nr:YdcF family protein [Acetobacteraceae bacterium]
MSSRPDPDAVIVIFGAAVRPDGRASTTLRRRVDAAARCSRRFHAPLFIPTGGVGRFGASEASVMGGLLRDFGVPETQLLLEETAVDTLSSVRAVRHLLRAHSITAPVYVATSAYHLPRCVLLLRLAGIRARACPPPEFPAASSRGLRWYWRLRELPALPYDAALVLGLRLSKRL